MKLEVKVEGSARVLRHVSGWSIASSFLTPTDGFSVDLVSDVPADLIDLLLQPVTISLDGKTQLVGRIEATDRGEPNAVRIRGRDFMSEATECDLHPEFTVKSGDTLESVLLRAGAPIGWTKVVSGDGYTMRDARTGKTGKGSAPKDFLALTAEDLKPEGQTIYAFCSELLARHGATLQPTERRGEVAVVAPHYAQEPRMKLTRKLSIPNANNLQESSATEDYSSFATYVLGRAKFATPGAAGTNAASVWDVSKHASDYGPAVGFILARVAEGIRKANDPALAGKLYRLHTFKDDKSRSAEQIARTVARSFAERFKQTLVYTAKITKFSNNLPAVDTIVAVDDDVCLIRENLWVESVTLEYSKTGGESATLTCFRPGSFVL